MKNSQIVHITLGVAVVIGAWLIITHVSQPAAPEKKEITIGVITPLSGDVAYYGESTRAGVALAVEDLKREGIEARVIVEDGALDAKKSLNAAQKLVSVDGARAIYSEFAPASIAVSSFLKGKPVVHVYDAAPVSPLESNDLVFKTYIDYEDSCAYMAGLLKERGVIRMGVLEPNMEFGQLCTRGIVRVFGADQTRVETYMPGEADFRTQLHKLGRADVDAVFNASFANDSLASLAQMRELGMRALFVATTDIVYPESIESHGSLLEGAYLFGLPEVDPVFLARLEAEHGGTTSYPAAAALAYLHITQLARALASCADDTACVQGHLAAAPSEGTIKFTGYRNRIAQFERNVRIFRDGTTEPLQ